MLSNACEYFSMSKMHLEALLSKLWAKVPDPSGVMFSGSSCVETWIHVKMRCNSPRLSRQPCSSVSHELKTSEFLFQHTIHGLCSTSYIANARMDVATYMTMSRDLWQCDRFYSRQLASSPLALLQGLVGHYSASQ